MDLDIAENLIFEMNILGKEQNEMRGIENSFSVHRGNNLRDCEVIGEHFAMDSLLSTQVLQQCMQCFSY